MNTLVLTVKVPIFRVPTLHPTFLPFLFHLSISAPSSSSILIDTCPISTGSFKVNSIIGSGCATTNLIWRFCLWFGWLTCLWFHVGCPSWHKHLPGHESTVFFFYVPSLTNFIIIVSITMYLCVKAVHTYFLAKCVKQFTHQWCKKGNVHAIIKPNTRCHSCVGLYSFY